MSKIYLKLFDFLEIGDDYPTIIMGVLNLSPESFYQGSVYDNLNDLEQISLKMIKNGAKMLDLGARSTAPWSRKITIQEEINRIIPAMELLCKIIPDDIILSIDTQYRKVAEPCYEIAIKSNKKIILNDVSCLKTDPTLGVFIVDQNLPIILMASKNIPGDCLTITEIIKEFELTIKNLQSIGYNENLVILDPGIGHWIKEKTHIYDLKIINNLNQLRKLQKPILVAISRKSFIGSTLNLKDPLKPEDRYNGTLSATAIAVFNGVHIVRTHDINNQLLEIVKIAEEIRRNK
ncbi:MAG: dihydropteroate synthase [Candidatus Hodarchaeota archaeon]